MNIDLKFEKGKRWLGTILGWKPEPTIVFGDGAVSLALKKQGGGGQNLVPVQLVVLNDGQAPCGKTEVEISSNSPIYLEGKLAPAVLKYQMDGLKEHKHDEKLIGNLQVDASQEGRIVLNWKITEATLKEPIKGMLELIIHG